MHPQAVHLLPGGDMMPYVKMARMYPCDEETPPRVPTSLTAIPMTFAHHAPPLGIPVTTTAAAAATMVAPGTFLPAGPVQAPPAMAMAQHQGYPVYHPQQLQYAYSHQGTAPHAPFPLVHAREAVPADEHSTCRVFIL